MLLASAFAFFQAWRFRTGPHAILAVVLGVLALALAAWHFRSPRSRPRG